MTDNLITKLYNQSFVIKNNNGKEVELQPYPIPQYGCVQYCRRLPDDLDTSVHYEIYHVNNGYDIALHAECQTADGNPIIREKIFKYLDEKLQPSPNDNFTYISRKYQKSFHLKECISSELAEEELLNKVKELLSELYNLVEDILKEAENNQELNPYRDEEEDIQNSSNETKILFEQKNKEPNNDEALWNKGSNITIVNVTRLLQMNLRIPDYQRPYKWSTSNVLELLKDIEEAIKQSNNEQSDKKIDKYRLGTIIVHKPSPNQDVYNIVDGQQRITTLALLIYCLTNQKCGQLLNDKETLEHFNRSSISRSNLYNNYQVIKSFFSNNSELKEKFYSSMDSLLEVVLIKVDTEDEAFQLFDSQNTRGRALEPHDLLKAHHLRIMSKNEVSFEQIPDQVEKWEKVNQEQMVELFNSYLFRIYKWSRNEKTHKFSSRDIDVFKGVSQDYQYPFVTRTIAAKEHFQIGMDFLAGECFFSLVDYYFNLLKDIKAIPNNENTPNSVKKVMHYSNMTKSFSYVRELFFAALFYFCDRFGIKNLDQRVISTLCKWSYALLLDLKKISNGSINCYAIGEKNNYSNTFAMFSYIKEAKSPSEISSLNIKINEDAEPKFPGLRQRLKNLKVGNANE